LTSYGVSTINNGVANDEKPLFWIASCKKDLLAFPPDVVDVVGYALDLAQRGGKHPDAKPMKGYGSGVLEMVEDFDGETYRAAYTVKFEGAVFALHAFQKKSKKGDETPKTELDKIKARLKRAEEIYAEMCRHDEGKSNGKAGSRARKR
jgi:phage-related protein